MALEKGETKNPNGRPRKFVSALRAQGYTQSQINDCILVLSSMKDDELREVVKNKDATVLEKVFAKAVLEDLRKGKLESIDRLLNRAIGKPRESMDITTKGEKIGGAGYDLSKYSDEELRTLAELQRKGRTSQAQPD